MINKIFILGPQGSGKGTQAQILAERLGIPALSMGQLLRDEVASGSALATEISSFSDAGNLVPDELALRVLKKRLEQEDAREGYILDGYPRNKAQYDVFADYDQPTAVLFLDVPREVSLERIMKRAEIEGRKDDTPELVDRRLAIYEEETLPIVEEYERQGVLKRINGLGTIEDVQARMKEAIEG